MTTPATGTRLAVQSDDVLMTPIATHKQDAVIFSSSDGSNSKNATLNSNILSNGDDTVVNADGDTLSPNNDNKEKSSAVKKKQLRNM